MKTWFKRIALLLVGLAFAAQLVRPDRTNPPVNPAMTIQAKLHVTPQVASIFKRACKDCHSHETVWPWYSNVTPINWLLANDVRGGRRLLNLSDWGSYTEKRALGKLNDVCGEVTDGLMPLPSYLRIHSEARLSPDDVKTICSWTESERARLKGAAASSSAPPPPVAEQEKK